MVDIRSYNLSHREHKNVGDPSARKQELKEKLKLAAEYLRDDSPMDDRLREAIAGLIEDYAFTKRGPKGSPIDILELGTRADELSLDGKKASEIDQILADEFNVGDENDQSTVKRLRLLWDKYKKITNGFGVKE